MHNRVDLPYWLAQFPLEGLRARAREFVLTRRDNWPDEYADEASVEEHIRIMEPRAEILIAPASLALNEQMRAEAFADQTLPRRSKCNRCVRMGARRATASCNDENRRDPVPFSLVTVAARWSRKTNSVCRPDDDIITTHADLNEAKDAFEAQLWRIRAAVDEAANIVLCFSCPSRRYFRHDLWADYKGNRKAASPLALRALKEWASAEWLTWTRPGLEADDVLGILATHPKLIKGEKIIVSHDKDLGQIPGLHLNPMAPDEGVYRIAPAFARRLLAYQVLVGDSTDN